jgi:DNA repair exonuclease SbcCD ATPase subunit
MSPTGKKRPTQSGRPTPRDPRADSAAPPREPTSMHPVARIAALESELARVQQERESEADDLAAMLVRIAEAERAKGTAAREALELSELVNGLQTQLRDMAARELSDASQWSKELAQTRQDLEDAEQRLTESKAMSEALRLWSGDADRKIQAIQDQLAQAEEDLGRALRRAELAEESAATVAASLQRAHAEREADQARVIDLETQLAALRTAHAETLRERDSTHDEVITLLREEHGRVLATLRQEHHAALEEHGRRHAHTLSAMREEHAAARRVAGRTLEEERSAAARARQQVTTLEASLTSARAMAARAAELLDELERREEMAASHRARTLEQTRQTLAGAAREPPPVGAPPPAPPGPPRVPDSSPRALDEIEIDLLE